MTGAGEGATGQDTGTAWVTRSTDCPEAPAQAHPLGQIRVDRTALAALLRRVDPQGFLSGDLGVAWDTDGRLAETDASRAKCDFCDQTGYEALICLDHAARAVTPRYTSNEGHLAAVQARRSEGFMIGEDYDWLLAAVGRVRGLLAAYGDAEGTPVDYEFLVHHIGEALE